jgi:hypothetical protein
MALSNWDTLAIGTNGQASPGEHTFKNGIKIEIYKNWSYLYDNHADEYPAMSINLMEGRYKQLYIKANRDEEQQSIFIVAFTSEHETEDKTSEVFAGIGCYGFGDNEQEYLISKGIDVDLKRDDIHVIHSSKRTKDGEKESLEIVQFWDEGKKSKKLHIVPVDKGVNLYPWVGVNASTLEKFKNFLEAWAGEEDKEEWFKNIDWDNLVRYNQGDAFFTEKIGTDLGASKVGEAEVPLLMQTLKGE